MHAVVLKLHTPRRLAAHPRSGCLHSVDLSEPREKETKRGEMRSYVGCQDGRIAATSIASCLGGREEEEDGDGNRGVACCLGKKGRLRARCKSAL